MASFDDRLIVARTPIPDGDPETALRFVRFQGTEEISRCFSFSLELVSGDMDIDAADLLGEPVTVVVSDPETGDPRRHFDGIVDAFSFEGVRERFAVYKLVLVPSLHFLSKTTDNRIFQEVSVVQIIETLFNEYSLSNYELRLNNSYDPRVYCVQYNETDLAFLERLMEHEGIFYFFEHGDAGHVLVITDDVGELPEAPGHETIRFEGDATYALEALPAITEVHRVHRVVTAAFAQTDYDFTKPSADLAAAASAGQPHALHGDYERYEYPGAYVAVGRGSDLATIRNDEDQGRSVRVRAVSNVPEVGCGTTFALTEFPREAENDTYFVHRVDYELADGQYVSGSRLGDGEGFQAVYALIPLAQAYRPERRTPRPVMRGPQTAQVVGPGGAEIHTDEYSRVKVQFHWDREGGRDENASCWVRVSAAWAGAGWGFIQIPRIGQEVIVDFLEGDPDKPIVTGRVYNAEQMPPYGLPGEATKSGWKSNSSPGGGGWNELMFEDKKGDELVYFQAEKDHDELVKNDETRHIGHDWSEEVVNDATQWVGHDRRETVDNDKWKTVGGHLVDHIVKTHTENVDIDRSLTVGNDETISVGSNSTEVIGMNHKQTVGLMQTTLVKAGRSDKVGLFESRAIGASQTLTVGLKRNVRVGSKQARFVKSDDTFDVHGNQTTTIKKNHEVKVEGDQSFWITGDGTYMVDGPVFWNSEKDGAFKAKEDVLIEAGETLVLKCGKAAISMKKDGTISIEGKDITVKGSGEIGIEAKKDLTLKGKNINQN